MEKKTYEQLLAEFPEQAVDELHSRFAALGLEGSQNTDPIFSNYCRSMAEDMVDTNNELGYALMRSVDLRRQIGAHKITPRNLIELNFRALQHLLRSEYQRPLGIPEYPHIRYMNDRSIWPQLMRGLLLEEKLDPRARELYDMTMEIKVVQSNVSQRAATASVLSTILQPWFGRHPSLLDGGTASMAIPLKLMDPGSAFKPIQVTGAEDSTSDKSYASKFIKKVLDARDAPRYVLGVDAVPFDPDNMDWSMACTIRGSEWWDKDLLREYERMEESYEPLRFLGLLDFAQIDLTDINAGAEIRQTLERSSAITSDKVDIAHAATTFYLFEDEELEQRGIDNLRSAAEMVCISDYCTVDVDDPTRLHFDAESRGDFSYQTYLTMPGDDSGTFYHFWSAQNGRNRRLKLGKDFTRIMKWGSDLV